MTNHDLITKLNSLKKVSPDAEWLKSNRELLLSQVSNSGATDLSVWKVFIINLQSLAKAASQPVIALGIFIFALVSAGVFSHQIFAQTKPNDSLYIARIISEKMRLNTVFNSQERDKLAVQFASEHAQDITEVLSNPEFNTEANSVEVAKLNDSFNKEVDTVKSRMSRLAPIASEQLEAKTEIDADVIIADNSKDTQGIQYLPGSKNDPVSSAVLPDAAALNDPVATSSDAVATSTSEVPETVNTDKMLDEAKDLFNKKDYNSALNKLKEVEEIMK
jgi:hypothetical protein